MVNNRRQHLSINRLINRSMDRSINESINHTVNLLIFSKIQQ